MADQSSWARIGAPHRHRHRQWQKFVGSDWPLKVRGLGLAPPIATAMKVAEPAGTTNVENFGDITTLPIFIRVVVNTCDG